MRSLLVRTLAGFAVLFAVMALALFVGAGTGDYWQAWLLLGVFAGSSGLITAWLWVCDRALLERRLKAGPGSESDPLQNRVQAVASVSFLATLLIPALDHRFGWSAVPIVVVILGDALVALGFLLVFLTFHANSFAAGTVGVVADQTVVDRGPYAHVRHPMYAGALAMFAGMPLALGSWWGLLGGVSIVPVLVVRLAREESFLADHLPGYSAYRRRVRFRLAPGLW